MFSEINCKVIQICKIDLACLGTKAVQVLSCFGWSNIKQALGCGNVVEETQAQRNQNYWEKINNTDANKALKFIKRKT